MKSITPTRPVRKLEGKRRGSKIQGIVLTKPCPKRSSASVLIAIRNSSRAMAAIISRAASVRDIAAISAGRSTAAETSLVSVRLRRVPIKWLELMRPGARKLGAGFSKRQELARQKSEKSYHRLQPQRRSHKLPLSKTTSAVGKHHLCWKHGGGGCAGVDDRPLQIVQLH